MLFLTGRMMNPGAAAPRPGIGRNKACYFKDLGGSELAEQQQDDQHHQNDAANAHSGMAHTVAVAAKPAAEAAKQEDDQNDDEYQAERHGILPRERPANEDPPPRAGEQSISRPLVPAKEPKRGGC